PYPLHRPGDPSRPRAEHWPAIAAPCLFIQGTKDPFCEMAVLRKVLPTLGAESALIEVPGGEHSLRVRKGPDVEPRSETAVLSGLVPAIVRWALRL
ncbi:MAG: alpha/beta family hydrolase, partial [Actinomycetota bacterium]